MVDLDKVKKVDILAAFCILAIIGQWNSTLPFLNTPSEIRKLTRAGGDAFLYHFYTFQEVGVDSFHDVPHGEGLYDLVRDFSAKLLETLPSAGRSSTLEIPIGNVLEILLLVSKF